MLTRISLILFCVSVNSNQSIQEILGHYINTLSKTPNFCDVANEQSLKCEEHSIVTEDSYILSLFHIPGDPGRPALLVHGLLDTSDAFILRGNISLAVVLSSAGYDVWAVNLRGNYYSRNHVYLNPEKKEFWQFSYQEFGVYDLPATIDYILKYNNRENIVIFAHSQGCTAVFVMGILKPEYNRKVELLIALAPVTDAAHARLANVVNLSKIIHSFYSRLNIEEYFNRGSLLRVLNALCVSFKHICYKILSDAFFEYTISKTEIDENFLFKLLKHYPAGTSKKNLIHVTQNWVHKRFAQYDYGIQNFVVYNRTEPPIYDISKITMKIAIFYAEDDFICTLKDMELLKKQLSNVVSSYVIGKGTLKHSGILWGKSTYKLLYPQMFDVLKKFTE